jgi:hypothetical protein
MSDSERFGEKVIQSGDCQLFTGATTNGGYGRFRFRGKTRLAHRVAFELAHGREPVGLVLHSCDVRNCVNHEHLREGTYVDNMQDAKERSRLKAPQGTEHGRSKLTEAQALMIFKSTGTCKAVGLAFEVNATVVSKIRRGLIWAHITLDLATQR